MNEQQKIRKMSGLGLLLALSFIFGIIGNYVQIGPVSLNFSLLPIAIAAMIYGPIEGMIIGLLSGLTVLLSPSTSIFYSFNVGATILIVLIKTSVAGLLSGLFFKLIYKKNLIFAGIFSGLTVPIMNTLLYTIGCYLFFYNNIFSGAESSSFFYFCTTWIGVNFIFEFISTLVLSPMVICVIKKVIKNYNIGSQI